MNHLSWCTLLAAELWSAWPRIGMEPAQHLRSCGESIGGRVEPGQWGLRPFARPAALPQIAELYSAPTKTKVCGF
jgi:hypothetical protein